MVQRATILLLINSLFFPLLSCTSDSGTKRYDLTATATPTEGGTVSPLSGEYEDGEQVEVSVSLVPNAGHKQGYLRIRTSTSKTSRF